VIVLPDERCRFFCDWVQDGVVNLFSRNEAFREMQRNGVERVVKANFTILYLVHYLKKDV